MPILSQVGRKSWSQRLFVWFLYATLTLFGATMAIPFLITLSGSGSNAYDYDRFSVVPRSIWSRDDRFLKGVVGFVDRYAGWYRILQDNFVLAPETWTSWRAIGEDHPNANRLAEFYLGADDVGIQRRKVQAADYCEFALSYPIEDTLCTFSDETAARFIAERYVRLWTEQNPVAASKASSSERARAGLQLLSDTWGVPIGNFLNIKFEEELGSRFGQQSWVPLDTRKHHDYVALKRALQTGYAIPGVQRDWNRFLRSKGFSAQDARQAAPLSENPSDQLRQLWLEFARDNAPASPVIPFPMRTVWIDYLGSDEVRDVLKLNDDEWFDVAHYNKLAGTAYTNLRETPFPLPTQGFGGLQPIWKAFVEGRYPLRLTQLNVTPELQARYQQFLQLNPSLESVNRALGTHHKEWSEFVLESKPPARNGVVRDVWISFVKSLPTQDRVMNCSESAYQDFLLKKYGSLEAINAAYGWKLGWIQEARAPFDQAYTVTYLNHQTAFAWAPFLSNYRTIGEFLIHQGNAIPTTLWLIVLSIFMTLTINPLAGYALSRFNLKGKDKIILFCLATAAFPAMVSAIPGYLLMRDLGLLNTFFALVLPGAANGMAIFILKGFFDSLPQELYEAATIDGAKEWQIFTYISLPMVKPIMAINALNAFIAAYSGWEWALIICQKKSMWTLSVWLYQASQWWINTPWITTAGFVIASIPTLVVFLLCQNIIMRGIVVPSMK